MLGKTLLQRSSHVQCQELKEVSLVESLYPLSLASADCEPPLKRVPTIVSNRSWRWLMLSCVLFLDHR